MTMNFSKFYFKENKEQDFERKLVSLKPQIVKVAQKVYDEWQQDESGCDVELGSGGICQDIADEIGDVLVANDIDFVIADTEGVVDQHVWTIAYDEKNKIAYNVDIDPSVYESGSGYSWKKKSNVKFDTSDIEIYPAEYETVNYYLGN